MLRPLPTARLAIFAVLFTASVAAQRNVLIIVLDDVGTDNVGVYTTGTDAPPTPRIDSLAAGGLTFDNAWANSMCSPTRAQLLTGRHGFRTGVQDVVPRGSDLDFSEVTLPEHLRQRGAPHRTGAFGKWHLNHISRGLTAPNEAGFDHFAGMFFGAVDYYDWQRVVNGVSGRSTRWATSQNVDDALDWIRVQREPWLCYFAPFSAHSPYQAPPPELHTQDLRGLDPAIDPRPFYRAMVEATDTEIGRLLDSLGAALADTHVIVLGDNGTPPEVVEPGLDPSHAKGSPYEPGIRVPLVVNSPAVTDPGRRVDALVSMVDVFATVGDLLDLPHYPPFIRHDGVSFAPYLRDPTAAPQRTMVFSELFVPSGVGAVCGFQTVRDARYKLIRRSCSSGGFLEAMFDLASDPLELDDLRRRQLSAHEAAKLIELAAAIDAIQNTSPRFEPIGNGACPGTAGSPLIRSIGLPRLGQQYAMVVERVPSNGPAILAFGSSTVAFGGLSLPFALSRLGGGAGCALTVSVDLTTPVLAGPGGTANVSVSIPMEPMLLGAVLHHQWLIIDPPASRLGITSSDGLTAVFGR